VSTSGFYEWRERPASATARRRERLAVLIEWIFNDSDQTYGHRRSRAGSARTSSGPTSTRSARPARSWGRCRGPVARPSSPNPTPRKRLAEYRLVIGSPRWIFDRFLGFSASWPASATTASRPGSQLTKALSPKTCPRASRRCRCRRDATDRISWRLPSCLGLPMQSQQAPQ
jgi:hypothetical protein